eukprot:scaffold42680_cov67-Phaeocystis_antarctica.AAC.5
MWPANRASTQRSEREQGSAACGSVPGGARRRQRRRTAWRWMDARRCVEGMSAALGSGGGASRWMAAEAQRAGRRASSTCVVFERERDEVFHTHSDPFHEEANLRNSQTCYSR